MSFVKVSKEQFTDWANKQFSEKLWSYEKLVRGNEIVICHPLGEKFRGLELHIYTSITEGAESVRSVGSDAIRFVLYDKRSAKAVSNTGRVNRTGTVEAVFERCSERVLELIKDACSLNFCKKCGAHAVLRRNGRTGENFYGCSGFPQTCGPNSNPNNAKVKYPFRIKQNAAVVQKELAKARTVLTGNSDKTVVASVNTTALVEDKDCVDTRAYKYAKFPFPKFNRVQSTIMKENYWDKDNNLVLGTTTSSGKTVCAELFMAKTLKEGKKVVYVSPLKSLTQEKYDEWGTRYSQYKIMILTGDYVLTDERASELNQAQLVCLTSEMIDSRTRNHQSEKSEWMFDVDLVIVDEAHIISTNRGHAVEVGLMRFSELVPSARILCLSATLPNVEDFKTWLTKLNGKVTEVINSDWRPTKLDWHFIPHITQGSYYEVQADKRQKVLETVQAKPTEKFLVFAHDKNTGHTLVRNFQNAGIPTKFHNADLSLQERLDLEKSFEDKEKGLRVLVSTSTLAWGRSLPARNVVITGVHRGINDVDELDIIQMAGRAGRLGIDPMGDCYLICDEPWKWQTTVKNPRKVESTLLFKSTLGFHILAEVKNGIVYNTPTLHKWFERTLAKLQMTVNQSLLEETLQELQKWNMLFIQNDVYKITRLGRVSATLYYFPKDIHHWEQNFSILNNNDLWNSDLALSYVMGTTPSLELGYVPRPEAETVDEYTRALQRIWPEEAWKVKQSLTAQKTYEFLSQGENAPLLRSMQNDIDRICQALKWIDGIKQWSNTSFWNALPYRIRYGVGLELVELCSLPGVGAIRAKKMYSKGLESIKDVAANPDIVSQIMGKTLASKVVAAAKRGVVQ